MVDNKSKSVSLSVALRQYAHSDLGKAVMQLLTAGIPYVLLWVAMVLIINRGFSYAWVIPLNILSALFLVRIFIFFHDMGHNSFFMSKRANRIVGAVLGLLFFTPYMEWQHSHNVHHATAGNLDKRGVGDVWTMTVEEYRQASKSTRFAYRFMRSGFVLLVFGPMFRFAIGNRIPNKKMTPAGRRGVWLLNLTIVAELVLAYFTIGLRTFLLIKLPMMQIAGALGIWLFFVQHQFPGVYWARDDAWDRKLAALNGCSYLRLPKVMQWFSGNIGFHHIHHLRSRIPNYYLEECYNTVEETQQPPTVGVWQAFECLGLKLYDEQKKILVGFREAKLTG